MNKTEEELDFHASTNSFWIVAAIVLGGSLIVLGGIITLVAKLF